MFFANFNKFYKNKKKKKKFVPKLSLKMENFYENRSLTIKFPFLSF